MEREARATVELGEPVVALAVLQDQVTETAPKPVLLVATPVEGVALHTAAVEEEKSN